MCVSFFFFTHLYCCVGCLSIFVWTHGLVGVLYACVLYFCICAFSVQLSMFHMERRSRNIVVGVIIIIITTTTIIIIAVVVVGFVVAVVIVIIIIIIIIIMNQMSIEF